MFNDHRLERQNYLFIYHTRCFKRINIDLSCDKTANLLIDQMQAMEKRVSGFQMAVISDRVGIKWEDSGSINKISTVYELIANHILKFAPS